MDFLKWVLKTSLVLALMFLGMQPDDEEKNADNRINKTAISTTFLF